MVNTAVTSFRDNFLRELDRTEVIVEFTKKDGTLRKMRCTLADYLIPLEKTPRGSQGAYSEAAQRVFDLDLNEWRAFRWDSVVKWTTLPITY